MDWADRKISGRRRGRLCFVRVATPGGIEFGRTLWCGGDKYGVNFAYKTDFVLALAVVFCLVGCSPQSTGPTLYQRLQDANPEVRVQAMMEAADRKDSKALPYIVENLGSDDGDVRLFAGMTLQKITGQTMGYNFYAPRAERDAAIGRWRQWLKGSRAESQPHADAATQDASTTTTPAATATAASNPAG